MNILIDRREKQPWAFNSSKIDSIKFCTMKTADYTVEGIEDKFCIERKKTTTEFAGNLVQPRFTKELERMTAFERAYIICEFSIRDVVTYPVGSDLPRKVLALNRIKGPFIMKKIAEMQMKYNITVLCCEDTHTSIWMATNLMKEAAAHYGIL